MATCVECGVDIDESEALAFGEDIVCANCKNIYVQRMKEGGGSMDEVEYGGFWIRFGASLIDGILLTIIMSIISFFVIGRTFIGLQPEDIQAIGSKLLLFYVIMLAIYLFYYTYFVGKKGATPGKSVLGLKIVRPDGSDVGYGTALGRFFAYIISAIPIYIGYIMAGFDEEKRALHDRVCNTRVIKT